MHFIFLIYTGAKYAGLELKKLKCWCGNKLSATDRLSEKSCETNCPDNKTSICVPPDNTKFFSTGSPGTIPYLHLYMYLYKHILVVRV